MPAARAASSREAPSSTSARASIRRAARASRHRPASRRSSTAPSSFRVTATVMAPLRRSATPPINARGPRMAPRAQRSEARALGISGDLVGGLGPDEGRGIVVVLGDVAVDGRLQLDDRAEDAAPEPPPAQRREAALAPVQPRARGRGEVLTAAITAPPERPLAARLTPTRIK